MTLNSPSHTVSETGKHRRRAYVVWIGAMIAAFAFVLIAPALAPMLGISAPIIGSPLPFFMIALTLFGVIWLAFYVFGRPRKADPDYKRRPAVSDPPPPARQSDDRKSAIG
ncbi:hypothetical protein [Hyphococcus sp.]|uniref:hypothetical protein n=1 Tax=Hyphococcus sp. TaxID=2038636 RepID=UPI0035C6E14D